MLFYIASRLISITGSVIYPTYASYKTLSRRPTQEADLERWLMYWSVMGCIIGIEMVAEWLIRWIPLYWYLKTMFLMYLALPQTQGATPIYHSRLQPLLQHYEPQIDASMARMRSRAYDFVRAKLQELWGRIINAPVSQSATPPTIQDNPLGYAGGLLRTYSPFLMGAAAMMQQPPAPGAGTGSAPRSRSSSTSSTSSFAPTDINLTAKAQPAIEPRSSAGVRSRTRNQPRTSETSVRPVPQVATSQPKQRKADDFEDGFHTDASDNLVSPEDGPAASKASSAYEKLKAD